MKKPTYPRIKGNNVTVKTKKGYRTYYGCRDVKDYKNTHTGKFHDHGDDIWYMKSSNQSVIIDSFIYEDKKIKATVKVYYTKNYSYYKWVGGRIDRLDRVEIRCNAWRTTKKIPTPFTETGYRHQLVSGGCTPKQAIKWVKSMVNDKSNIRKYNKAIKQIKEAA